MDVVRSPDQVMVRKSRDIEDQERPSENFHPRYHEWQQRKYTELLWGRLLAFIIPELSKLDFTRPWPRFTTQPTQSLPSTENFAFDSLALSTTVLRRRSAPAQEKTKGPETEDQRAEATGIDLGFTGRRRRFKGIIISNPRRESHEARKRDLLDFLEPVLGVDDTDSSSILLCWGKDNGCHIIPVKVPSSANDVTTWQEIRRAWYAHRGDWREYVPLFDVRRVDNVKISIIGRESAGKQKPKQNGSFIGTYTDEDLASEKQRLEQIIDNYRPQQFPCPYNFATGETDCSREDCVSSALEDEEECPERRLHRAKRELSRLKLRPFLTKAFSDPGLAALNDFLLWEDVIYSHKDILRKLNNWHCPSVAELGFRALMINEGWPSNSQHIVVPLTMTFHFLLILGAKLVYDDWNTVWAFGNYFVGLALLPIWANCAVN